jgi:TorA maturation chaperone TorD
MLDRKKNSLLSRLWLNEADEETLAQLDAVPDLKANASERKELAVAYADAFLLNVYPYASVFLDLHGEMNGLRSRELSMLYVQHDYQPASLNEAGAPDHIGFALGLLERIPPQLLINILSQYVLDWAPVLCLAVERQPAIHPFYRAVALATRNELFRIFEGLELAGESRNDQQIRSLIAGDGGYLPAVETAEGNHLDLKWRFEIELPLVDADEEKSLSQFVHSLLCPAQSGLFLSRAQLGYWASQLGVPLPFGERHRLGISLFEAAGMVERVPELLSWILAEADAWDAAYLDWAKENTIWTLFAGEWRERIATTRNLLVQAQRWLLAAPLGEYDASRRKG